MHEALAVVRPTRFYLLDIFCTCIQFYVLFEFLCLIYKSGAIGADANLW